MTIGVPVYNGERFLRETLEAVLAQEFRDYELLISDNASTDGTERIVREFLARDSRISYQRNAENIGAARNFDLLAERARGTYFIWAGAHDQWAPTFLAKCVAVMESCPKVVLCYCPASCIDAEGRAFLTLRRTADTRGLGRYARYRAALWRVPCYALYGLHRITAMRQVQRAIPCLAVDVIRLTEMALLGEFAVVPEPLFRYRLLVGRGGDWAGYFRRLDIRLTWWNPPLLAWRYVAQQISRVSRHATGPGDKAYLALLGLVRAGCLAGFFLAGLLGATLWPGLYQWLARRHYGVPQK